MSNYTVLVCPTCGGKTNLSTDTRFADCQYCGNKLVLQPNISTSSPFPGERRARGDAPMPESMRLDLTDEGFEIARRWYSPKYIFLAVFCFFWDGFLFFWYSIALSGGAPLVFALFPIFHLAVGAVLTYTTLAGFLNTSYVTVSRQEIRIQHHPLPYPGNRVIPSTEIDQLYVREQVHRSKNGTTYTYTLSAVQRDGKKIDLLKGLESPEAGFFVEQKVEEYLRLPDRPIAGEVR